ncbi:MAG TPA: PAS domain S-box protein [Anaerolineales bacterium]|nr:PAS domain S-box protein [Anaerolineales bacterium]
MIQAKPTYQELEQRCLTAESALSAIRSGQADTVLGEQGVLVLRLKETEKALQEAELKYRTLAENSPDIIYIIDLTKNKSGYLNRETLLGYTLEELERPGEFLLSKIHPDDLSAVKAHWQAALAGNMNAEMEYRLQLKDGSWEWLQSRPRILSWDVNGRPTQLLVTLSIITERKQAEKRLRSMLDIAQTMSTSLDTKTTLQQIVDSITQVTGLDSGAIYTLTGNQLYLATTTPALPPEMPDQFRFANLADHPHIQTTLAKGSSVIIPDTEVAELTEAEREICITRGLRSIAYLPLMSARTAIGVLIVASTKKLRTFTDEELLLYHGFSVQAAQTIENAQLYDSARVHSNELEQQISERKQAEKKLQESEKLYRYAMEVAGTVPYYESYSEKHPAVTYEFIGEGIRQITGYGPEEFNSQIWDSLVEKAIPVEELEGYSLDEAIQRTRSGEFPIWKCEFRLHDRDGKTHWVFEAAVELRDANGNPVGSIGSYQDITIRKQAEEKLRKSEEQYRLLFEVASDGVVLHLLSTDRIKNRFRRFNQNICQMLGYTAEELAQLSPMDIQQPAELLKVPGEAEQLERNRELRFEKVFRRKDGSVFPSEVHSSVFELDGELLVLSIIRDISERKQAEAKLRESEEKYRGLMEAIDSVVATIDYNGRFLYLNEVAAKWLGGTPQELVGKTMFDLFPEPMALQQMEGIREVFQENQSKVSESLTYIQGQYRWFHNSLQPIHNELGEVVNVLLHAVDVHELKVVQQELADLNRSLEQRIEERTIEVRQTNLALERALLAKDEFLANMSHELRTPLNGILGMAEILLEEEYGLLNERQHAYVNLIDSSGHHLLSLINDVLDLSKVEVGKLELDTEKVFIEDLCQSSMVFVRQLAKKKNVLVNYLPDPAISTLQADARRLKQILVNLLSNAVKFTPEGGKVMLEVHANRDEGIVTFSVTDTGIGISEDNQKRLFQPFTQVDSSLSRKYDGTGLGLALVKRLTELHGGTVALQSEVGRGSCFTVSLPWREAGSTSHKLDGADAGDNHKFAPSAQTIQATVLLVEDNTYNVMAISEYLEAKGYRLVFAVDGLDALAKAAENSPDLILMDIQMPNMDGLEATRRLRSDSAFASIPIIALTAHAMGGDRERCLAAGATDYLSKPVKLKELESTIRKWLSS